MSARIVLTTFGSFGDVHPYLALGLGLKARGHQVTIATSGFYRERVLAEGLAFHTVRPEIFELGDTFEMVRKVMDRKTGPAYFIQQVVMPHLRDSYEDLLAAVQGTDLLVTHMATYAGPLAAEKLGLRWVSSVLQPFVFLSPYDPPVVGQAPGLARLRGLGPGFHRALFGLMRRQVRTWSEPARKLRADIGLPPSPHEPLFEGQHSPYRVLALFSRQLGAPQPDWPSNTVQTGFLFYDRLGTEQEMSPALLRFLDAGEPPIVFTLGSSAVLDARGFYRVGAEAACMLDRRAVLLIGPDPRNRPTAPLPASILACEYAPYSQIFPRAAAIVHQGGVGTTGQAMRAGKPTLIMPYSHDQPDNAARMVRLGISRTIDRDRYTVDRVRRQLEPLLYDPSYARRAEEVGRAVSAEDGLKAACDCIEAELMSNKM